MNIFKRIWKYLFIKNRSIRPRITLKKLLVFCVIEFVMSLGTMLFLFLANIKIIKVSIDYSKCRPCGLLIPVPKNCICKLKLIIPKTIYSPVTIYYKLNPFFQNYALFNSNYDKNQLIGVLTSVTAPSKYCVPQVRVKNSSFHSYILPCGSFANSIFNDSFTLKDMNSNFIIVNKAYTLSKRSTVYRNPKKFNLLKKYDKPLAWSIPIHKLDTQNSKNNGVLNRHFITWMWPSPFSYLVKPYGIIEKNSITPDGNLPAGLYTLLVNYNYPTANIFSKELIISNEIFGGTDYFLLSISLAVLACIYLMVIVSICAIVKFHPNYVKKRTSISPTDSQKFIA